MLVQRAQTSSLRSAHEKQWLLQAVTNVSLCIVLTGCGRLGFSVVQITADAQQPPALDGSAGDLDGGPSRDAADGAAISDADATLSSDAADVDAGDAPSLFVDSFDRADGVDLGTNWLERIAPAGSAEIRSNQLVYTRGAADDVQDMLWYANPTGTVDQWACIQFVSTTHDGFLAFSLGFRSAPHGDYLGLSAHPDENPPGSRTYQGLYESFTGSGMTAEVGQCVDAIMPGVRPGEWLCGSTSGPDSGPSSVRLWRFPSDPGIDPSTFPPPDCEWTTIDDTDGDYLGFGVWTSAAPVGTEVMFDNFRAGTL